MSLGELIRRQRMRFGWTQAEMTMDRYTHLTPHHQEGAASALGEALFATDERDAAGG